MTHQSDLVVLRPQQRRAGGDETFDGGVDQPSRPSGRGSSRSSAPGRHGTPRTCTGSPAAPSIHTNGAPSRAADRAAGSLRPPARRSPADRRRRPPTRTDRASFGSAGCGPNTHTATPSGSLTMCPCDVAASGALERAARGEQGSRIAVGHCARRCARGSCRRSARARSLIHTTRFFGAALWRTEDGTAVVVMFTIGWPSAALQNAATAAGRPSPAVTSMHRSLKETSGMSARVVVDSDRRSRAYGGGVSWTCPQCQRQFARNRQGHECAPAMSLEEYFSTGPPFERPVFDAVMEHLRHARRTVPGAGVGRRVREARRSRRAATATDDEVGRAVPVHAAHRARPTHLAQADPDAAHRVPRRQRARPGGSRRCRAAAGSPRHGTPPGSAGSPAG